MRRTVSAIAFLVILSGCTSYTHTEQANSQIAFGSEVAQQGLWREAHVPLRAGVAKEPNNARAHNNLAVALEASGEYARALEEYKKALELEPNDNYIRRNYARFAEFYTSYTRTTGKARQWLVGASRSAAPVRASLAAAVAASPRRLSALRPRASPRSA